MSSMSEIEKARLYETILALVKEKKEAYRLFTEYSFSADISSPMPSWYGRAKPLPGFTEDEVLTRWRMIRDGFESAKVPFDVIGEESPYFPRMKGELFPFIYSAGDKTLLAQKRVTLLGSPLPSVKGKSDTLDAVKAIIENGSAVMAPLEAGIGAFALQIAIRLGGKAIGVLSCPISSCSSEALLPLQKELYLKGLLISVFPPSARAEKWMQKIRNEFLSSISGSVFLAEEKDGGPSWSVADPCLKRGDLLMMPLAAVSNPLFSWMGARSEEALIYRSGKDIKKLVPKGSKIVGPDLFS